MAVGLAEEALAASSAVVVRVAPTAYAAPDVAAARYELIDGLHVSHELLDDKCDVEEGVLLSCPPPAPRAAPALRRSMRGSATNYVYIIDSKRSG